jgi:hypothetical protein
MTGRRTTDEDIAEKGLERWAGTGTLVLDPNLNMQSAEELDLALGCIRLGRLCISKVPVDRPNMEEVADILENLEDFVQGRHESTNTSIRFSLK